MAGCIKAKFIFNKSCRKNIARIKALARPRIWQFFRPGMLVFLAIIIPTGAWMSKASAGNFSLLCVAGAVGMSIGVVLLISDTTFWGKRHFVVSQ